MGKLINKKDKLNVALVFSGFLHLILMVFIIANSSGLTPDAGEQGDNANVVNAVMVDSVAITQQYRRQKNQEAESKLALERQQKKAQQQAERLLKKQNEEQQRLKNLEKERLQAEENARQEAAERKRQMEEEQRLAEQQKQAIDAIKKAQEEQKQAQAEAAKAKAQANRLKAEAEKKAQAEQKRKMEEAKARKESAKIKKQVDELFDNLASSQNTAKTHKTAEGKHGSDAEIKGYLNQITSAIQSKFYDADLYKGKTCNLRIKLAPDGVLISVTEEGGDPALCQAALAAAKQAPIPEPPNKNVYQVFKNASLVFKP